MAAHLPSSGGRVSIHLWQYLIPFRSISTTSLGLNIGDPGIGNDAAKVVADCIHSSRVKEMGLILLKKNNNVEEEDDDVLQSYDRLGEEEIKKFQLKLARTIIVFIELLHVLIARNRDLLLSVIQERKRGDQGQANNASHHSRIQSFGRSDFSIGAGSEGGSIARSFLSRHHRPTNSAVYSSTSSNDGRFSLSGNDASVRTHNRSQSLSAEDSSIKLTSTNTEKIKTDSAIAVQSELQRAFISLTKALHPLFIGLIGTDTPSWLKLCCQESYFSSYTYRQTKIRKSTPPLMFPPLVQIFQND